MKGPPQPPHGTDLELVRASLGRNTRARQELAQRMLCVARILAAKNARAGAPLNDEDLADVVQDSVTILWSKRAQYEGRAAFESWAYRVGVLEWMNAVRRKSRRGQVHRALPNDLCDQSPEEEGIELDASALILEALHELGSPDGDVIRRKHFDDASFREIGSALDVSINTVKFWYYRGLEKLRGQLLPKLEGRS